MTPKSIQNHSNHPKECPTQKPISEVMVIHNRDMGNKQRNYRDEKMYENYKAVLRPCSFLFRKGLAEHRIKTSDFIMHFWEQNSGTTTGPWDTMSEMNFRNGSYTEQCPVELTLGILAQLYIQKGLLWCHRSYRYC